MTAILFPQNTTPPSPQNPTQSTFIANVETFCPFNTSVQTIKRAYKMSPVRRIAQIIHLKPSAVEAYKECHANVWPEVLQQIKDCNIIDCMAQANPPTQVEALELNVYLTDSIFFDNDRTLFATFKYVGTDYDADMEKMRANPKVREWWVMTDGMQVCYIQQRP